MDRNLSSRKIEAEGAHRRSWCLTPLHGKRPVLKNWTNRPHPSLEDVLQWADQGNLGLRTGSASGVVVIDIDPKNGGCLSGLPKTPTVITGSCGRHHYFETPEEGIGNSVGKIAPGVDVRGDGGQVVYPGSLHPQTGQPYRWADGLSPDDVPLAELPDWISEILEINGYHGKALAEEVHSVRMATEGERNNTLNHAAFNLGQLVGAGSLSEEIVVRQLTRAAFDAGLGEKETERTFWSGLDAGKRTPRGNSAYCANSAWEYPIPFGEYRLPRFPTETLPQRMRDRVEAEAEFCQVPTDMPAIVALSVGASAIQKKAVIATKEGHAEPLNLYTVPVLPSGERKSPVISALIAPLSRYEQEESERMESVIAEARCERTIKEKTLEEVQRKAAKGRDEDAKSDAARIARELEEIRIPELPRLLADDATPERMATLLYEQGGRLSIFSAEGDLFDLMAGRYSRTGPNFGIFLKAHSGCDDHRVDRVGRPAVYVSRPALTICLAVQPDVLKGLTDHPGFRGRGLLARFLYALPESRLGRRSNNSRPVPPTVRTAYEEDILALLKLPASPDGSPYLLRMSPEAWQIWNGFEAWIEPKLAPFAELNHIADWTGKLAGTVARIAGILHMIEHSRDTAPWNALIKPETVENAVRIGRYLIPHARAAFDMMDADPLVGDARHMLNWIRKTGLNHFTERDAFNGTRGRFKRVKTMRPALDLLEEHRYIRKRILPERKGRGRSPSPIFEVNPLTYTQITHITQKYPSPSNFADSANSADTSSPSEETGVAEIKQQPENADPASEWDGDLHSVIFRDNPTTGRTETTDPAGWPKVVWDAYWTHRNDPRMKEESDKEAHLYAVGMLLKAFGR